MLGCRICHGGEPPHNGAAFANPLYLFDNELFARRVMDAAPPSLTSLRLAAGPCLTYDPVSTYWMISRREGGQKHLVRVPDDDKSATSAIDDMCLPEEAKVGGCLGRCVECILKLLPAGELAVPRLEQLLGLRELCVMLTSTIWNVSQSVLHCVRDL